LATILDRILASKREEVAASRSALPESALRAQVSDLAPPRAFEAALRAKLSAGKPAIISEIKRASPSQGVMKADIDPAAIAQGYEKAGAACLSVLTDRPYFQGSPADLKAARAACTLPVLRKDFLVDAYQVWEARAMQADCILLIAGAVPLTAMQDMAALARELGMAVLVESHRDEELTEALQVPTPLMGINNRDLSTFKTDLSTCIRLSARIPDERLVIAESGISSPGDVQKLRSAGIHSFLVGGAFMSAAHPGAELSRIFAG
jgi:indole-3-glycerol phosphate synthase